MNLSLRLAVFVFTTLSFLQTYAQQPTDSTLFNESIAGIHQFYFNRIGNNAQIYQGNEYIRSGLKATGFPYYEADSMFLGTITYMGTPYIEKKFFYDLVADQLIIYNYTHDALLRLYSEKVDSFSIGTHHFIYLRSDKSNGLPNDGFYEKLLSGNPSLYVKRRKLLSTATGSEDQKYILKTNYYIEKNSVYYLVDSKKTLMEIFDDQHDALNKFIRSNKLDYKKDLENALLLSTIYYSRIKN